MISKNKVAVTGITGHLGFVLTRQLIEKNYTVRAVVRNIQRAETMAWITQFPIELVQADMTDQAAMEAALDGMEGLFHAAAVFDVSAKNPDRDVVQQNIKGTESTLMAAVARKVRKVVYTSSVAAVGTSHGTDAWRDESNWNEKSAEPYARSKALSEKKAWEIARHSDLNLIAALPGAMLGPHFHKLNPTLGLIKSGLDGEFPMALPIDFNFVDVRDVADAHIRLYESDGTKGRYIVTNQTSSVFELLTLMNQIRPEISVPKMQMPLWFARIFPFIDSFSHFFTHRPKKMTAGFVKEYVGRHHAIRSDKMRREFNWSPRDFRVTLEDTIAWFEQTRRGTGGAL